jgi:hypothetical protein
MTIDTASIIKTLSIPIVNAYVYNRFQLQPVEIAQCVIKYMEQKKRQNNDSLSYYYERKLDPLYQDKMKKARQTYYEQNKTNIRALQTAKYHNDPLFQMEYRRYQALYKQKKGAAKNIGETRGRPKLYDNIPQIT